MHIGCASSAKKLHLMIEKIKKRIIIRRINLLLWWAVVEVKFKVYISIVQQFKSKKNTTLSLY